MHGKLSIPDKLNLVLTNLSEHQRLRFIETLEKHPEFLEPVLKSIDLKLHHPNNHEIAAFELDELNKLIQQTEPKQSPQP